MAVFAASLCALMLAIASLAFAEGEAPVVASEVVERVVERGPRMIEALLAMGASFDTQGAPTEVWVYC